MPVAWGVFERLHALREDSKGNVSGRFQALLCYRNMTFTCFPKWLKTISCAIEVLTSGGLCLDDICDMVACKGRRLGVETRGL